MHTCKCGCGKEVRRTYAHGHGTRVPLRERLLAKVVESDGCWIWQGAISSTGYGVVGVGATGLISTHRAAYAEFVGPITEGLHIDHLCRNRACCNPAHLEAVSQAENNRRAVLAKKAAAHV